MRMHHHRVHNFLPRPPKGLACMVKYGCHGCFVWGGGGAKERTCIIYAVKRKSNTGGKSNLKPLRVLWVLKLANALRQLQTVCKGKQGRAWFQRVGMGRAFTGRGRGTH